MKIEKNLIHKDGTKINIILKKQKISVFFFRANRISIRANVNCCNKLLIQRMRHTTVFLYCTYYIVVCHPETASCKLKRVTDRKTKYFLKIVEKSN